MNLSAFRVRVLGSAVLGAVVALLVVLLTFRSLAELLFPEQLSLSENVAEACAAAPEVWRDLEVLNAHLMAFDEDGRQGSLQLDPLALSLVVGQELHLQADDGHPYAIRRLHDRGPCTFLKIQGGPPPFLRQAIDFGLPLGTALAVLVVGLATYRFTILPLIWRIRRLRDAAGHVGEPTYDAADDEVGDDLAAIGSVLDRSHARILADRTALEERHQALEKYMAELAHDLRTPLASMLLALQEVHAETEGAPLGRAIKDADYVATLVENLHHATRLRHGLDPLEGTCDLGQIVQRLEVRFAALGRVEGVEVGASVPDGPVVVRCSPALAERAVGNLVQNAVSHGAQHVAILLDGGDDGFVLRVLDDGPGVPPETLADLGKRTFTDDPARKRGPGLGIAITNEVARRAGWSITYEAGEDGGLEVRLQGPSA